MNKKQIEGAFLYESHLADVLHEKINLPEQKKIELIKAIVDECRKRTGLKILELIETE